MNVLIGFHTNSRVRVGHVCVLPGGTVYKILFIYLFTLIHPHLHVQFTYICVNNVQEAK